MFGKKKANTNANGKRKRSSWLLRLVMSSLALVVLLLGSLIVLPVASPDASAALADQLRVWLGPDTVAEMESVSFQIQDAFNQLRFKMGGGEPQLTWEQSPQNPGDNSVVAANTPEPPAADSLATPAPQDVPTDVPTEAPSTGEPLLRQGARSSIAIAAPASPTPLPAPIYSSLPYSITVTWQSLGTGGSTSPYLMRAGVQPDPYRPYAQVALVRIDLAQTLLHVVPGSVEPIAARDVPPFPRPGMIPVDQQVSGNLVAAFNGGFKAVNGQYGMMVNGITLLPPINGLATVAVYADGSVRMGAWGRDLTLTPDMVAYRQNCPLLVDAGAINPAVNDENRREWGYTVRNLDTTWRSGLGLTKDRRYLIYAVGTFVTVEALARSLQAAGAYWAMQLDINSVYTRFVTYHSAGANRLVADKLLYQMAGTPNQFLAPYQRDFMYVTARR